MFGFNVVFKLDLTGDVEVVEESFSDRWRWCLNLKLLGLGSKLEFTKSDFKIVIFWALLTTFSLAFTSTLSLVITFNPAHDGTATGYI